MLATLLFALLLGAPALGAPGAVEFWPGIWRLLERLEAMDAREAEATRLEAQIRDASLQRKARSPGGVDPALEDFRFRLLSAHLARWRGDEDALLAPDGAPSRYAPAEAWLAARVLEPGLARALAFAQALEEASDAVALARQIVAYDAFQVEVASFRGEAARILAHAMHASAQLTWSATCVEFISRRLGDYDAADAVLMERLQQTDVPGERLDLLQLRGLGAMGAGRTRQARDLLGRALALGGADAAPMLGREALALGRRERAAALFRTLLTPSRDPAPNTPWALRGWGLSLLPAAAEGPPSEVR